MLGFQGVLASQQGGTVPVEGFAYYFLLQDGTGVTAFALYEQGAVTEDARWSRATTRCSTRWSARF